MSEVEATAEIPHEVEGTLIPKQETNPTNGRHPGSQKPEAREPGHRCYDPPACSITSR